MEPEEKGENHDSTDNNPLRDNLFMQEGTNPLFPIRDVSEKLTKKKSKLLDLSVVDLVEDGFKNLQKYKIGNIDWSEEILKDF